MIYLNLFRQMGFHKMRANFLGNLATSLWFIPRLCIFLHKLRGVRFADTSRVFLGRNVILDNRYPELLCIGKDVWITAGCLILTHSSVSGYQESHLNMREEYGEVVIGDGVFIGSHSVIVPNVTLGRGSYIGAGSVVVQSIPEHVLAAGNPAKVVRCLSVGV